MEKVREQIKEELQKQDDWANHWDSWEAWGEEIEGSIKLLSTGIDSLFSAMESHNRNCKLSQKSKEGVSQTN